jgi:catechol 2,3-dioxygenase-like lactoylglutathione lyase family enzyme
MNPRGDTVSAGARRLRLIHAPTPDWDEMRRFYHDVLGLPEVGGWDLPGDRGAFLTLPILDSGPPPGAEIELMEQDMQTAGVLPEGSRGWHLALEVADLDAECQRLRTLGVPVVRQLKRHPWGARDFVVQDPAGNPVLLFEAGAPPE